MWWIVLIGVGICIFYNFISDNNKQANIVAKQGGMRIKYRILVDYFLSGRNDCHIIYEVGTSIKVGASSQGGNTYFNIVQTFGRVTIVWTSMNELLGKHELEWQFNEFMNQKEMINKINNDIEIYMSNVLQKYK